MNTTPSANYRYLSHEYHPFCIVNSEYKGCFDRPNSQCMYGILYRICMLSSNNFAYISSNLFPSRDAQATSATLHIALISF